MPHIREFCGGGRGGQRLNRFRRRFILRPGHEGDLVRWFRADNAGACGDFMRNEGSE